MEHRFVPYVDPDYRKVQRVLKSEIPYKTKSVKQFDVPAYYRANVKDKKAPIYVQVSDEDGTNHLLCRCTFLGRR